MSQEITTKEERQIRQQKGEILTPPHKYGLDLIKQKIVSIDMCVVSHSVVSNLL